MKNVRRDPSRVRRDDEDLAEGVRPHWNKVVEAGPAVGDEVTIALDLEFMKDQPKTAAN